MMDLFTPVVPPEKFHPNFARILTTSRSEAKALLNSWADGFIDRDGKFVQEFQTTFNSCYWELYLFAVFKHMRLAPDLTKHAPDFLLTGLNPPSVAEAVVASHAEGYAPEWDWDLQQPADLPELIRTATIRLSNSIVNKHRKYLAEYRELAHVKDKPFILCVAPFDQPGAYRQNLSAIRAVLYGIDQPLFLEDDEGNRTFVGESLLESVDKDTGSTVPVGLFRTHALKDVSAVMFSTTAGWGKVDALAQFDDATMIFAVQRYNPDGPEATVEVKQKANYRETLVDGLHVCLNPFAAHPFDPTPFQNAGASIDFYDPDASKLLPIAPERGLIQRVVLRQVAEEILKPLLREPPAQAYKKPSAPAWREGELRATGSYGGPFTDNHLAHYRAWTVLVAFDSFDEEWIALARHGLFRTVASFQKAGATERDAGVAGSYRTKGSAAAAAFTAIDLAIEKGEG